jgi:cell division protein FtsW (lipid II flippase)
MPAWKVVVIGACACICLALALATLLVPMTEEGSQKWLWMGGLLTATLLVGALFTLFLRHASGSLDVKPRGIRH